MQVSSGANSLQEPKRLGIATGENMLPVVDALARCRIAVRCCASPESRPCFNDVYRDTGLCERGGGGQTRKAAADHNDSRPRDVACHEAFDLACETGSRNPESVRAQVASASSRRAGRGTRIRRVNTS